MTDQNKDTLRARADELMLLRLNGHIEPEEAAELDDLLAKYPDFAGEEAFLKALKSDLAAREPGASPGAFGLARLKRAVDAEAGSVGSDVATQDSNVVAFPGRAARTWRYAAIAATVLLSVQTVGVLTNPEGVIRLAGGTVERPSGPVFTIAFVPEATEAEIRALLIELDLSIVNGPSALGLYQVAAGEEAAAEAALVALRAAPVVESAERK